MTQSFLNIDLNIGQKIPFFSVKEYLSDKAPIPEDIIYPRILTKRGLLVFGGPPKIGKSDFLISWLVHMLTITHKSKNGEKAAILLIQLSIINRSMV